MVKDRIYEHYGRKGKKFGKKFHKDLERALNEGIDMYDSRIVDSTPDNVVNFQEYKDNKRDRGSR